MLPDELCQITLLSVVEPTTVAVKETVPPVATDIDAGETVTELTTGSGGFGVGFGLGFGFGEGFVSELIRIMAEADLVGSATLVAVTVDAVARAGAVYKPVEVTAPIEVVHVTASSVVAPAMVALN